MKQFLLQIFLIIVAVLFLQDAFAQVQPVDTFFLLKKKGLLKRLGESIYRGAPPDQPKVAVDPFLKYKGMVIRTIEIGPTGLNNSSDDTGHVKRSFGKRMANKFHVNTLPSVIRKNLFFKEGDRVLPLLLSDNERFLRELTFLKDALIQVEPAEGYPNMVDVYIVTKDVFSIGGSLNISNPTYERMVIREENIAGSGNTIEATGMYDKDRNPQFGEGASIILKNIRHSFVDWTAGFTTFNPAFNTGYRDEKSFYTSLEKPLINRYSVWTGAATLSYNQSTNGYMTDSLYISDFKYIILSSDLWAGYNIGGTDRKYADVGNRLRHFVALRSFYNKFDHVPQKFVDQYNYGYANLNGMLASYSLYRQNFFKTKFVYGFGRNEDIPQGLNASIVAGYTNKQGVKRAYYGFEFDGTHYSKKDFYTGLTFKLGGFTRKKEYRDIDMLVQVDRFTKLRKLSAKWLNRNFLSVNFTKQFDPILATPLFLQSQYGLPYFRNNTDVVDARATVKLETVFYNLNYLIGFRCSPFLFADASFLKPQNQPIEKTNGYSAVGGGVRIRNENLTFGTIELRGYYFPRVIDGMKNWKVEITTNLRFRFNSSFIRKPDFISPN